VGSTEVESTRTHLALKAGSAQTTTGEIAMKNTLLTQEAIDGQFKKLASAAQFNTRSLLFVTGQNAKF